MNKNTCLIVKVDFQALPLGKLEILRIYDKKREIRRKKNNLKGKKTTPLSFKYKQKIKSIWFKFKLNTFVFVFLFIFNM